MSEELKKIPKYVFEEMIDALSFHNPSASHAKRSPVNAPIYSSCHIECADSLHQGQFQSLASNSSPVIFNNTCSSWYEIAITFIDSGARAYLGTIWRVDNATAREAAKTFYQRLLKHESLLDAFYEMTKEIRDAQYRSIYLFWGLHFSTLKRPSHPPDQDIFNVLMGSLIEWRRQHELTNDANVKVESQRVLGFIAHDLKTYFGPMRLKNFQKEMRERLAVYNQLLETGDSGDDLTERGVVDL
jgi:hypothetical protein